MRFRVGPLRLTREWRGQPTDAEPRWSRPGVCRTAFELLAHLPPEDVRERLERLLRTPDPEDLVSRIPLSMWPYGLALIPRGRVLTHAGAEDRFRRWLPVRVRAIRARELAQLGLGEAVLAEQEVASI